MRRYPDLIVELRTARANGVPHSTLRRGGKVRWRPTDRILALALTVHEDGLCPGCGHPRDRSLNEDMEGEYLARRVVCQACRTAHLDQDAHGHLRGGESLYVLDQSPAGYEPDPRMMPRIGQ